MKVHDIPKFARQNSNLSIFVYSYETKYNGILKTTEYNIYPLYKSIRKQELENLKVIDSFYITHEESAHYCWIKNLSRLVSNQISKHNQKKYICRSCFSHYYSQENLKEHEEYCNSSYTKPGTEPVPLLLLISR